MRRNGVTKTSWEEQGEEDELGEEDPAEDRQGEEKMGKTPFSLERSVLS